MQSKSIDVGFIWGAIRNSEQEHIAIILRDKAKVLISFGSCSVMGGIPGLANLSDREEIFNLVYKETPSTINPDSVTPLTKVEINGNELTLPKFYNTVKPLNQVVDVDYYVNGCPPPVELIETAVEAIVTNNLPPKGSRIGAAKALCDVCPRERKEETIKEIKRIHEGIPDPEKCFLDDGYICMGPATRGDCEARCIQVNMPCRGCQGGLENIPDQGAKMISALGSLVEDVHLVHDFDDAVGTFYMYSLPASLIKRKNIRKED